MRNIYNIKIKKEFELKLQISTKRVIIRNMISCIVMYIHVKNCYIDAILLNDNLNAKFSLLQNIAQYRNKMKKCEENWRTLDTDTKLVIDVSNTNGSCLARMGQLMSRCPRRRLAETNQRSSVRPSVLALMTPAG